MRNSDTGVQLELSDGVADVAETATRWTGPVELVGLLLSILVLDVEGVWIEVFPSVDDRIH